MTPVGYNADDAVLKAPVSVIPFLSQSLAHCSGQRLDSSPAGRVKVYAVRSLHPGSRPTPPTSGFTVLAGLARSRRSAQPAFFAVDSRNLARRECRSSNPDPSAGLIEALAGSAWPKPRIRAPSSLAFRPLATRRLAIALIFVAIQA